MKTVYAMSYVEFVDAMISNKLDDSNIEERTKGACIEIMGEQDLLSFPFYFKHEHHNVLRLLFDDVDEPMSLPLLGQFLDEREYIPLVPMNEKQAKAIFEFVKANSEATGFFIHCAAGMSRSAGVAQFITEYFSIPYKDFHTMNPQARSNSRILNMLRNLSNRT